MHPSELPTWYSTPSKINLPIERIVDGPFEGEVAVSFQSNSEIKSAVVPAATVNRTNKTVDAQIVGEAGDYSLVALPGSSSGNSIALILTDKVSSLAS